MTEELFVQKAEQMQMSQAGGSSSEDSKDLMNKLALMNYVKWTIFLVILGTFICKCFFPHKRPDRLLG